MTSYDALLDVFFASHDATRNAWSRQYMSAIFYRDENERAAAVAAAARYGETRGKPARTEIAALDRFYLAEDYHQKYRLRAHRELAAAMLAYYPKLEAFVDSPAVTRMNAYLAGHGSREQFERDLPLLGLDETLATRLAERVTLR